MIFNIQKCSVHDGEGIRTIIFFKGCPLHCKWCSNPESQKYTKQITEFTRKCIGCGMCRSVCDRDAIIEKDGMPVIDRERCNGCMKCAEMCFAEAKTICGKEMSADELFNEIRKDKFFYDHSGGGVTFSGGEALTQPELLTELARKCKKNRISTTIETCGCGDFEKFKEALPYIDYMFFDLKVMDSEKHKEVTGAGNEQILRNLEAIQQFNIPCTIRTPVIPGINDSEDNIRATAEYISSLPSVKEYELLPYHDFGVSKYAALGREYELRDVETPDDEHMRELTKIANDVLMPAGKICFFTMQNAKEYSA